MSMGFGPSGIESLSENGEEFCLGEKGSIGKARGGSRPAAVCDRQATPPAGPSLPNPPGGGSFRLGLRWFGRNRPQEVCPAAHRLAQPRIPQPQNPSPFSDRLSARERLGKVGEGHGFTVGWRPPPGPGAVRRRRWLNFCSVLFYVQKLLCSNMFIQMYVHFGR